VPFPLSWLSCSPISCGHKKKENPKKNQKKPQKSQKKISNAMQLERKGRQPFFILRTLSGQTDNTVFYFL
jgi:hypothetical protein